MEQDPVPKSYSSQTTQHDSGRVLSCSSSEEVRLQRVRRARGWVPLRGGRSYLRVSALNLQGA